MANHLNRKHEIFWKQAEETKISDVVVTKPQLFSNNSAVCEINNEINHNFTLALASSTAPFYLIENNFFKKALKILNPSYAPPSHQTLSRKAKSISAELKLKIKNKIDAAQSISIVTDFWTGKDGLGYLGIIATFLEVNIRRDYLICLKPISHPHTAHIVRKSVDEVLKSYGILGVDDEKLFSISTDNGSNMVAGLSFDSLLNVEHISSMVTESEFGDDIVEEINDYDEDVIEFEYEYDFFQSFSYNKRIPCADHLLNNNLKSTILKNNHVQDVMTRVQGLIRKLKGKGKVVDFFFQNKLTKLILPPLTRWQYHIQMIDSILRIKNYMPTICQLVPVDNLSLADYETIEKLQKLFRIYEILIKKFEQFDAKISDVIPSILNMSIKLLDSDMIVAQELRKDLIMRSKCIFDTSSSKFNSIFALSTFLDPSTRNLLNMQSEKLLEFDLKTLKDFVVTNLEASMPVENVNTSVTDGFDELDKLLDSRHNETNEIKMYMNFF